MTNTVLPKWKRLDNAAKIFPSSSSAVDSKVFRLACELEELIDPEILQSALDKTMEKFPFYQSVMKRGIFWYYLEECDIKPVVELEKKAPCRPIYDNNRKNLLFRVLYFKKRISVEMYHVLTDGTGALEFLCMLVYYYIVEKYKDDFKDAIPSLNDNSTLFQKEDDSFRKYYKKPENSSNESKLKAYHIKGERLFDNNIARIEGRMSLSKLLECSRGMKVTLTELMTAIFIQSIQKEMSERDQKKPIVITIPVNLRSYFPSDSARNFFTTISTSYNFSKQENDLDKIIIHIRESFQKELLEEKIRQKMNTLSALEHSVPIRMLPLIIKDTILKIATLFEERSSTASFSNIGKVSMPKEMEKYIRLFDAFTSPNILQACACSFRDNYVLSFATPFKNHNIECNFFRHLSKIGIEAEITTSGAGE